MLLAPMTRRLNVLRIVDFLVIPPTSLHLLDAGAFFTQFLTRKLTHLSRGEWVEIEVKSWQLTEQK